MITGGDCLSGSRRPLSRADGQGPDSPPRDAPACGNEPLSEEPTMSPFMMIDLARAIEADHRRESRIAAALRRARSAR
jgi:hypothetical protein